MDSMTWSMIITLLGGIGTGVLTLHLSNKSSKADIQKTVDNCINNSLMLTAKFKEELRQDMERSDARWANLFEKFHIMDKDMERYKSHIPTGKTTNPENIR